MNKKLEELQWKYKKVLEDGKYYQNSVRIMDMPEEDLKKAFEHCKEMLYNNNSQNPGRYAVLNIIADQRNRCGAELFLRYLEQEKQISRLNLLMSINEFMSNNKEVLKDSKPTLDLIFTSLPDEFKTVPLELITDGCLDTLGAFNKKHITKTFILKQGVWLTLEESRELNEKDDNGEVINILTIIRERLNLKDVDQLHINSKGLSYSELRAMIQLKTNKKYREMTTLQLTTLRNKILFILEQQVKKHIDFWEETRVNIEKIASIRNINLF